MTSPMTLTFSIRYKANVSRQQLSIFTSHVSGQGNRIGLVCVSVCVSVCQLAFIGAKGLWGQGTVHFGFLCLWAAWAAFIYHNIYFIIIFYKDVLRNFKYTHAQVFGSYPSFHHLCDHCHLTHEKAD